MLISRDDRALALSTRIAGGKDRAGLYDNDRELADLGIIVVNLSAVQGADETNHWKFAQLDQFAPELRATLKQSGISLPAAEEVSRGSALDKFGTSLGSLVSSASNVVVTLPTALIGR